MRNRNNEAGQVLIMVAIMLPVMLGVMGLALDVGTLHHHRRRMQTAADAGALAGANELWRAQLGTISPRAHAATATNQFTQGTEGTAVSVHYPPQSGYYAGNARYVEVTITQSAPTYFMRVFGWDSVGINARAVAGAGPNSPYCIYVMDPSMPRAFEVNSSAHLDANCGVIVNSTASNAMHMTSSTLVEASHVSITGGYVTESNAQVTPTPQTDVPPEPDPLAYLPAPEYGGCNHTNFVRSSGTSVLSPGVYCGGINLQSNARATLNPGMYIIRGGGIKLESSTQMEGNGVTFYLTQGAGFPYAPIDFQSSTQVRLTAPSTGTYAGILFFQDRNAGSPSDINRLASSTNSYLEGALYFSTQILRVESSTATTARYTLVVVRSLVMDSSPIFRVNNDYSGLPTGSPIKKLSLVE